MMQDLVDPIVVAADAEVAGLYAQRLANREERVEHQFLRDDPEHAPRLPVFGDDVVPQHARAASVGMGEPGK